MRRNALSLMLLTVCVATMQAQAPSPGAEMKKLNLLVGRWTYEGENKPSPLGPGAKYAGVYTAKMILGGSALEEQDTVKEAGVETQHLAIEAYDSVTKTFVSSWYGSDGTVFSATVTVDGNTITWAGHVNVDGKQYQIKDVFTLAADLQSAKATGDVSIDGKTWTPLLEARYVKVKPPGK